MFTAGDPELAAQPAAVVTSPQPTVTAADEQAVTVLQIWLLFNYWWPVLIAPTCSLNLCLPFLLHDY